MSRHSVGGDGEGGVRGVRSLAKVTQRVMVDCTRGNNVLSHLGKLLSCLGDFEIH